MIKAVLFDLDDTLLSNDMAVFLPAYFERLTAYARARFAPGVVVEAIRKSTSAMIRNQDPTQTNRDVFWTHFERQVNGQQAELEPFFEEFYTSEFPHLRSTTKPVPAAVHVVEWFRSRGYRVVLATNPVFPLAAIEQRIQWAGFADSSVFDLVTAYDNMHATKPNVAYYQEILRHVESEPSQALMVGNDWDNDIEPAQRVGMRTFHVMPDDTLNPARGQGSLLRWYETLVTQGQEIL